MQLNGVERDRRARFLLRTSHQPARLVHRSLGEVGRSGSTFQCPLIVTGVIVQLHGCGLDNAIVVERSAGQQNAPNPLHTES